MIRLVCVVEVEAAETVDEAQRALDAFREAVQPNDYGLSLFRASEEEADTAIYGDGDGDSE